MSARPERLARAELASPVAGAPLEEAGPPATGLAAGLAEPAAEPRTNGAAARRERAARPVAASYPREEAAGQALAPAAAEPLAGQSLAPAAAEPLAAGTRPAPSERERTVVELYRKGYLTLEQAAETLQTTPLAFRQRLREL